MQRLRIDHVTQYSFREPTALLPHRLLLRPREDHSVRIASSELEINPRAAIRWQRDALDNSVAIATFNEKADQLRIASTVVIEHYEEAPLDFVVDEFAVMHPFVYPPDDANLLAAFVTPSWAGDKPAVRGWLSGLALGGEVTETFVLLDRLNRAIHEQFRYQAREEPGVLSPSQTLERGAGSCRDFAALFVDACRQLGRRYRPHRGRRGARAAARSAGGGQFPGPTRTATGAHRVSPRAALHRMIWRAPTRSTKSCRSASCAARTASARAS